MDISNGIFVFPSGKVYIDQEWIDAHNNDEKPEYYYCTMLNYGHCFKHYKPSVAELLLKRGAFLSMINIKDMINSSN